MRYRWKDLPRLVRTPPGRQQLFLGQFHNLWPVLRSTAALYRRSLLRKTRIVAVIGSLGKSTTMRAVRSVLGLHTGRVPPTNSWSGLAVAVLGIRPGDTHGVLEVGIARKGTMTTYARMIRPDIAVVTSIAGEHLYSLKTFAGARHEKAELVRSLPPSGYAVLNGDDPNVRWMASQTSARVLFYGFREENNIRILEYDPVWPEGNRLRFLANGLSQEVQTRLFGRHMVYPVLAAAAVGLVEGRNLDHIASALSALQPTAGRLEIEHLDNNVLLLKDDFKSTLETIHSAIATLADFQLKGVKVILGEVTTPPKNLGQIHRNIGRLLAHQASKVIIVGKSKTFKEIRSGAKSAGTAGDNFAHAGNYWMKAYHLMKNDLLEGDIVLIKGRRTQRLDRITLFMQGRPVRCQITECTYSVKTCFRCKMLERGWDGLETPVSDLEEPSVDIGP